MYYEASTTALHWNTNMIYAHGTRARSLSAKSLIINTAKRHCAIADPAKALKFYNNIIIIDDNKKIMNLYSLFLL